MIDVNNLSRGIPVISYRINDLPIRSPRCRNINNLRPVNRQPSEDRNTLRFCTINARSLNNKAGDFIDFICDYKPDIASITETWFHENESATRVLCTPAGYNLLDYSRTGRLGGGTGIMFRKDISVSQNAAGEFQSFEYSEWNITSRSHRFRLIIIYRPPYSDAHPITTGVFLAEFSDYLEHAVLCTDQLLICGDFNIHVDVSDDLDACRFLELLDSVGLDQYVSVPTHISGHTLDLIITRNSDQLLVSSPWTDYLFSDHLPVHCNIQVEKPLLKSKRISFRKLKSIDISSLRDDLSKSDLCSNAIDSLELNDLVTHVFIYLLLYFSDPFLLLNKRINHGIREEKKQTAKKKKNPLRGFSLRRYAVYPLRRYVFYWQPATRTICCSICKFCKTERSQMAAYTFSFTGNFCFKEG